MGAAWLLGAWPPGRCPFPPCTDTERVSCSQRKCVRFQLVAMSGGWRRASGSLCTVLLVAAIVAGCAPLGQSNSNELTAFPESTDEGPSFAGSIVDEVFY